MLNLPVILVSFGIAIFVATINTKVFSDNLKMNKKITMREDFQDIKRLIESSIDCSKTAACSPNDPVNLKKADGSSVFELENTGSGNKRFGRYHKLRAICGTDQYEIQYQLKKGKGYTDYKTMPFKTPISLFCE